MSDELIEQYIDKNGYYRYYISDRLVHRAIAQHTLGKDIRGKVVHHKNYNKLDNRPENLQVMTEEAHDALHDADYDFCEDENRGGYCIVCGHAVSEPHHEYCSSCYFEYRDEYGDECL